MDWNKIKVEASGRRLVGFSIERFDHPFLVRLFQLGLYAQRVRAKGREHRPERRGCRRRPAVAQARGGAPWQSHGGILLHRPVRHRRPSLLAAGLRAESGTRLCAAGRRSLRRHAGHVRQRLHEHDDEHEHALRVSENRESSTGFQDGLDFVLVLRKVEHFVSNILSLKARAFITLGVGFNSSSPRGPISA